MEHKCLRDGEISALKENVKTLYSKTSENKKDIERIDKRQDALYKLTESVAVIAERITTIQGDIQDVKQDVGALKTEVNKIKTAPGETWGKFKWALVVSGVGLVMAYFFKLIIGG